MNKKPYGENGYIDFARFWDLLRRRRLNKQWLVNNGIHSNTVSKLVKNENVTCAVIAHLCFLLDCQVWEIMEYRKSKDMKE